MRFRDELYGLNVRFDAHHCALSPEEKETMEGDLDSLGKLVETFPSPVLHVEVNRHPRRGDFHVKTALRLSGRTLFTGERDPVLHPAYDRCVRRLINKVKAYKERLRKKPGRERMQHGAMRELWPAQQPDLAELREAVEAGDYPRFRAAMEGYEDALEHRVGRWIQRYPQLEARLGKDIVIGDIVDEILLGAFEGFLDRPADRLGNWLEGLIDPAVRALLDHLGLARTSIEHQRQQVVG